MGEGMSSVLVQPSVATFRSCWGCAQFLLSAVLTGPVVLGLAMGCLCKASASKNLQGQHLDIAADVSALL